MHDVEATQLIGAFVVAELMHSSSVGNHEARTQTKKILA